MQQFTIAIVTDTPTQLPIRAHRLRIDGRLIGDIPGEIVSVIEYQGDYLVQWVPKSESDANTARFNANGDRVWTIAPDRSGSRIFTGLRREGDRFLVQSIAHTCWLAPDTGEVEIKEYNPR